MLSFKKSILGLVGSRVLAGARVEQVEILSEHFRLIDLVSEGIKGSKWEPGAKMKVNVGNWEMRTYTPLSINSETGRVQILTFLHGNGDGSTWATSVKAGDLTHTGGPRPSLQLKEISKPTVFFGDETSLAAAKTLQVHLGPDIATSLIFEVTSVTQARAAADRLALRNAEFFEKPGDKAHIPAVAHTLKTATERIGALDLILSGNGVSIQGVRAELLKGEPIPIKFHIKAYWSPGKSALE